MDKFYVICKRRMQKKDYAVLFWRANSSGYTYDVKKAGIYENLAHFPKTHYFDDQPVQCSIVDSIIEDAIIDNQFLGKICKNISENRLALDIKFKELRDGGSGWDKYAFCEPKDFLKKYKFIEPLLAK